MIHLRMAWRFVRRDWRAGELRLLIIALIIALAAFSAVQFFVDRIEQAIAQNANSLLAADLVVSGAETAPDAWIAKARSTALNTARYVQFPSMAFATNQHQLADVKAVSDNYPLRGELEVGSTPFGSGEPVASGPAPGEAWAESRLLAALDIAVGDVVQIGSLSIPVTQVIVREPDRGSNLISIGPRLMIHESDLARAELLGPGSRARYNLLISGDSAAVTDYRSWVESQFESGWRIVNLEDRQQAVTDAMQRANQFLDLAALAAIILCAVAIIMAVARFYTSTPGYRRHFESSGRRWSGHDRYHGRATVDRCDTCHGDRAGAGVSDAGSSGDVFVGLVARRITDTIPTPFGRRYHAGIVATGRLCISRAGTVAKRFPMRVLNRQPLPIGASRWITGLLGAVGFATLIWWQIDDPRLALFLLGGTFAGAVVLALIAWVLIVSLRRFSMRAGLSFRYGLASIHKHPATSLLQIVGFGLCWLVLVLLMVIRSDLFDAWRANLPENAPNTFFINIQSDQAQAFESRLKQISQTDAYQMAPMAMARISAINGEQPDVDDYDDRRAQRRIQETVRISWRADIPPSNRVIAGQWWSEKPEYPQVSLAQSWAQRLQLELGDTLTFDVGGTSVSAEITSIREVEWDSFQVNFFILLSPLDATTIPHSYITSAYIAPNEAAKLTEIVRAFPTVTLIDVDAIMQRVRTIIDQASLAIEFVFAFSLLAGFVVIAASVLSTQDQRKFEASVFRAFGARKQLITGSLMTEFSIIGAISGALGVSQRRGNRHCIG